MTNTAPKLVFDAAEVADFCATDVATIYTWVKKGEIAFFKTPGGRLRFKREAVLDFLRKYHFPIPPELSMGRPHIAVVDDDPNWILQIKRALSRSFDVTSYQDPYDALLSIGDEKPDGIVLDAHMPTLDGIHCIKRIRAWNHLPHARIVVFSGHEDAQAPALDAGASAFVLKPGVDELAAKLKQLLGMR